MSRLTQEKEKFEYQRATYKIRHQVFCPTSRSRQESEGFVYRQATYKGRKYKKPRKPLSPPGLVCCRKEKKRERPRKVVCCHKKGTWKKEKKRKRPRKARRWLREGKVPCVLNQEFLFWFRSVWVLRDPSRLKYWLLRDLSLRGSHVRRKFRKQTTLRSKNSTLKGLLYAG